MYINHKRFQSSTFTRYYRLSSFPVSLSLIKNEQSLLFGIVCRGTEKKGGLLAYTSAWRADIYFFRLQNGLLQKEGTARCLEPTQQA